MNFKEKLIILAKKVWQYISLARVELLILVGVLAFDLITKAIIGAAMDEGDSWTLIPNFLYFTFTINKYAAFGSAFGLDKILGPEGVRIVFLIFTGIAMVVFAFFMVRFKRRPLMVRASFALIIAGGLGNFFDRLFLKGVRDFVEIVYFGLDIPFLGRSFAIFNMADAALTVGVILFIIYFIFIYKEPKKKEAIATEDKANRTTNDAISVSAQDDSSKENEVEQCETAQIIQNKDEMHQDKQ